MEADLAVRRARKAIEYYQASLERFEEPYRKRMAEAEKEIVAAVLLGKQNVTLFGVAARFSKGRETPSWKAIAMTWMPSKKLIAEHISVGEPKVTVGIVEDWGGENGDS